MPTESQPQQGTSVGTAAQVQHLHDEISSLRDVITQQQQQIQGLLQSGQARGTAPSSAAPRPTSSTTKAPQIPPFTGKRDDQTSMKVKAFIYNVRKVGKLSGLNDAQSLELAECYLQERAAMWMLTLERAGSKPNTVDELQAAMIREFVPPDERARAKTKLMTLKLNGTVDSYVSRFRDLVDICDTPRSEAYLFFFNGLPDTYKEEFTKHYPTGEPTSIQQVYEHARTVELARQWTARRDEKPSRKPNDKSGGSKQRTKDNHTPRHRGNQTRDPKDPRWGPAAALERNFYRRHNRCFDCGVPWNLGHKCSDGPSTRGDGSSSDNPKA